MIVSILLVTFNAEKYIEKTLRSCLEQTYLNFEILVLDNASSDRTLKIVKNIKDSRITCFEGKNNIGPYAGLNFLLNKTSGKYIAIQDHDDIWYPEKLTKQVDFLNKNSKYIACGTNTYYYYESKNVLVLNSNSPQTNFVDHTSLFFRNRNFRYDCNFLLADEHFEKKVLAEAGKIGCLQTPLTIHRIKGDATNLSTYRFKINFKNINEYFYINGFNVLSLRNLLYLIFIKIIPDNIIWKVKHRLISKNGKSISVSEFVFKNPKIDFI